MAAKSSKPDPDPDRIYGALLGAALGDALAARTKGKTAKIAESQNPGGVKFPSDIVVGSFPLNGWTDTTSQLMIMLQALTTEDSDIEEVLPRKLSHWKMNGFAHDEKASVYFASRTWSIADHAEFVSNPEVVASQNVANQFDASAMVRAIPTAFLGGTEYAKRLSALTHPGRASVYAEIACGLIELAVLYPKLSVESIISAVSEPAAALPKQFRDEVFDTLRKKKVEPVPRSDEPSLKALACTMWAMRIALRTQRGGVTAETLYSSLSQIALLGGDSTVNCALVGAVLGARLGYAALPHALLNQIPHMKWFLAEIQNALDIPPPPIRARTQPQSATVATAPMSATAPATTHAPAPAPVTTHAPATAHAPAKPQPAMTAPVRSQPVATAPVKPQHAATTFVAKHTVVSRPAPAPRPVAAPIAAKTIVAPKISSPSMNAATAATSLPTKPPPSKYAPPEPANFAQKEAAPVMKNYETKVSVETEPVEVEPIEAELPAEGISTGVDEISTDVVSAPTSADAAATASDVIAELSADVIVGSGLPVSAINPTASAVDAEFDAEVVVPTPANAAAHSPPEPSAPDESQVEMDSTLDDILGSAGED